MVLEVHGRVPGSNLKNIVTRTETTVMCLTVFDFSDSAQKSETFSVIYR